jgi:protein O-mannosyl-transferase
LWGASAFAFHLTNVLLHALCAAAFFEVARRLLKDVDGALMATLLFAVHPLRVESVSWISERRDLLCGIFCCMSVATYLDGARNRSLGWFVLAGLSKGMAVTLPVVLLLLDRKRWKETLPFFGLSAVLAVSGFWFQGSVEATWSWSDHGLAGRLAQSSYAFSFYLVKSVLPVSLSPFYPLSVPVDPWSWPFAGSYLLIAAGAVLLTIMAGHNGQQTRKAAAAYAVILLPVCGLFQFGAQLVADRYSYLATMPLAVLAGAALRGRRALAGVLIAVYASACVVQQSHWRSPAALWSRVLVVTPESGLALLHLGNDAARHGRAEHGLDLYRRAQASDPACLPALEAGDAAALKTRPVCRKARSNEGAALAQLGRLEEAEAALASALRADPSDAAAARNLARLRSQPR